MGFVGFTKLSLLDYPDKISCILFTSGCNFRCPFCHNGLTLLKSQEEMNTDEIISYLKTRVNKLDGVVISGGEPTLQKDLIDNIRKIKELGFLVKLDTNGTNPKVLQTLIEQKLIDYVAMDIKNSPLKYGVTIDRDGFDISSIKESISILKQSNIDYEFRTTLVKEFHDDCSIKEMGELIKGHKKLYLQKYTLSDGVINKNLHPVDEGLANKFKDILSNYIEVVELRGY